MKRLLGTVGLALGVVAFGATSSAEAASFLSIQVGATTISCDNSTAAGVLACTAAGFDTSLNANTINFTGALAGVTFGDADTVGVQLQGNQPGGVVAFATDTKSVVTNTTAVTQNVIVMFASNNFSLPAGSPLNLSATQNFQNVVGSAAMTQNFTGSGDPNNSLTPGAGTDTSTPPCNVGPSPPSNSCAQNSPTVQFARTGNFALSGTQSFNLVAGATVNAQGSVNVFASPTVPEPGSMLLLGAGLLMVARRFRKQIA